MKNNPHTANDIEELKNLLLNPPNNTLSFNDCKKIINTVVSLQDYFKAASAVKGPNSGLQTSLLKRLYAMQGEMILCFSPLLTKEELYCLEKTERKAPIATTLCLMRKIFWNAYSTHPSNHLKDTKKTNDTLSQKTGDFRNDNLNQEMDELKTENKLLKEQLNKIQYQLESLMQEKRTSSTGNELRFRGNRPGFY